MNQKPIKHEGRTPSDTITKEHLKEFIATQDDFALELYAYNLARELGFKVTHAGSYIDPQTGKARQYDVQASRACGENFHIYMAIECKALRPSFPLLVSRIPRIREESFQHIVNTMGKGRASYMGNAQAQELSGGASLYPMSEFVGKASSQVGFNGEGKLHSKDSEVFEKWGQAIASSNQLISRAASLNYRIEDTLQSSAVLPVLVVPDETLWVVDYYGVNDSAEPIQANEAQYFIGSDQKTVGGSFSGTFTLSHLHIVTKTGLENLLRRFGKDGQDAIFLTNMLS